MVKLLYLLLFFGCFGCHKKQSEPICIENPFTSEDKNQRQKWELENWDKSCAKFLNPYNKDYSSSFVN